MCDLIDLNSPNIKGLVNSKLSSPLIPVPENVESDEQASSSATEKRESLDNNPFDNVLHETAEYVRKKGDPFEVMLQRALKSKSNRSTKLKTQSVTFKDDFTPKRKRKFLKMMNKTLDESLIEEKFDSIDGEKKEGTVSLFTKNTDVCDNNAAKEKDILSTEFVLPKSLTRKPYFNVQRSLSQGNNKSPTKLQDLDERSQSITDTMRIASQSDSTVNCLNTGFLENRRSQQSIFSDLSDVSSMARSNSALLISNLSSISSGSNVNRTFLDSDFVKMSNERINTAEDSTEIKSIQYDLTDLTKRCTVNCSINRTTSVLNLKGQTSQSMEEEDDKTTMNNKLVDVDVFMLKQNFNKEHNKSTNTTSSSDSVFIDNSTDKLILNEAKELSRIFEELAIKTDTVFNMDDLLSNDTLWMSELLPAFEDESTDNLIDLPVSPNKTIKDDKNDDLKQCSASTDNAEDNFMKEIESQFTDCIPTVKQTMVTTLLSDLKKLVEAENNSEASKLIDNLESVLGVKYKNNVELLTNLNVSNELQSPEMSKLNNTERSGKTSICINKSQEENEEVNKYKEKVCDNENILLHVNHKLEDISQTTTANNDNSLAKSSHNHEDSVNIGISSKTVLNTSLTNEKNSLMDEQLAVELLLNLGKLLSGQAEDTTTLQLLKNIGKALNIAFNNCKNEEKSQMDDKSCNAEQIMALKTSESEYNVHVAGTTEATQEQSLNFNLKSLEKSQGSISAIHSSNVNTSSTQVKSKCKNTSVQLKDQKLFSSKPALINIMANKKIPFSRASNTRTAEIAKLSGKNEKLLAITDVKKKLKKKTDIVNKKGPMKAMHLVDSVQKKVSLEKRTAPSSQVVTPPKSNTTAPFGSKIISSTPNSMDSSTPDDQTNGTSKTQLKSIDKKRNFSCDISPVTTQKGGSSRRSIQPRPVKICTPKRVDSSSIPKYCTPPRKLNSSLDMNSHQQQSPQYLNKNLTSYQRYSPPIRPKSAEKRSQNSFKESKFLAKVKPFKLISKLKGNTTNDFTEKENCSE